MSLRTRAVDLNEVMIRPPHVNTLMFICQCYGTLYQVNQEVIAQSTYKSVMETFFLLFSLTLTNDRYGMKSATIFQNPNNNMYTNHNGVVSLIEDMHCVTKYKHFFASIFF